MARRSQNDLAGRQVVSATIPTAISTTSRDSSRANTVVLAVEPDPADENHSLSMDNLRRLELASHDPAVGPLRIVQLPFPQPVTMLGERLPASYANFYIANGVVIVPTFNDANDVVALRTLAELFPGRQVVGIHARDLGLGFGDAALPYAARTARQRFAGR